MVILSWELHSQVVLDPDLAVDAEGLAADGWPVTLRALLVALLDRRPDLSVIIVQWRAAVLFRLEREAVLDPTQPWADVHPRLSFREDGALPLMASHHQKLVAVDRRLAFCGGLDLTAARWDTLDHPPTDPRRRTPGGEPTRPWHDVQVMVDGAAARALARLTRRRWSWADAGPFPSPLERADGASPLPSSPAFADPDPWPAEVVPDLYDLPVAIARTEHAFQDRPEVREIEAGLVASIAAAREWVWIEHQYLTSDRVAEALQARLAADDGPEVVIILPYQSDGAAQQATMDTARDAVLDRLRAADSHRRLGLYWPVARPDGDQGAGQSAPHSRVPQAPRAAQAAQADDPVDDPGAVPIYVHAKLLVIDGRSLRIGSANLANRSMGLDTECDVILEACTEEGHLRPDIARVILATTETLAASLLGTTPAEVAATRRRLGSWRAMVEALRDRPGNTLVPFTHRAPAVLTGLAPDPRLGDPDRPLDAQTALAILAGPDGGPDGGSDDGPDGGARTAEAASSSATPGPSSPLPPGATPRPGAESGGFRRRRLGFALLVGLVAIASLLVWLTPETWRALEPEGLVRLLRTWQAEPLAPVLAVMAIVGLGLVGFPITVMVLAVGLTFDPVSAVVIALAGITVSASLLFALGRLIVDRLGRPLAPEGRLGRIAQRIGTGGAATVAALRNLPILPFTVMNLLCGAAPVRFRDYLIGTVLGMAPGTVALAVLGDRAAALLRTPDLVTVGGLVAAALATAGLAHLLQRWADRREGRRKAATPPIPTPAPTPAAGTDPAPDTPTADRPPDADPVPGPGRESTPFRPR